MNQLQLPQPVQQYLVALRQQWKIWVPVTAVCFVAATLFALLKPATWEATQSLILRDEAAGQLSGQGRFDSLDTMKAAQEMVVEVARNSAVLEAVLEKIGPAKKVSGPWPTLRDIEDLRKETSVAPPSGAEFGTTEVLHLSVQAPTPQRAIALTETLCDEMEATLKSIRNRRADSVIAELQNAQRLAEEELARATAALNEQEKLIGSDLGELRSLNVVTSGDGTLRNAWNGIRQQIRESESDLARLQEQRKILSAAQDDPQQLIATPNQLLESQPALRRLKDGLVDAQLRTSELLGRMSESHPQVQSARAAEEEIQTNLRKELAVAIRGVEAELQVQRTRLDSLTRQETQVRQRLDNLAGIRAQYGNLVADVEKCNQVLRDTHQRLAEAKANKRASETSSVITRIDHPTTGQYPLGPGKTTIALGGLFGGLLLGVGLVVLLTPAATAQRRRWTDRIWGRRASDAAPGNAPSPGDRRAEVRPADQTPNRRAADLLSDLAPGGLPLPAAQPRAGLDRRGG